MRIDTVDGIRVLRPSRKTNVLYHVEDTQFLNPAPEVWLAKDSSGDDWVESKVQEPIIPDPEPQGDAVPQIQEEV